MARKPQLTRDQALAARPQTGRIRRRTALSGGITRLEVEVATSRLVRTLLRVPPTVLREYELDAFGMAILEQCDGKTSVRQMVRRFAGEQKVNESDAERAITSFLRLLMRRGVVQMVVDTS